MEINTLETSFNSILYAAIYKIPNSWIMNGILLTFIEMWLFIKVKLLVEASALNTPFVCLLPAVNCHIK